MNAVSIITPAHAIGMLIVLTRMVAITVAVWTALRETGQCVKVCSFLSCWNGYNYTCDIFGRY